MSVADVAIALFAVALWGINFVAMKLGVDALPPLLLSAVRFIPVLVVLALLRPPRPAPWSSILAIGAVVGLVKFTLLYLGIAAGMPSGLASLVLQSQAIFTVVLAALIVGERPGAVRIGGVVVATAGLALAAGEVEGGATLLGFAMVVAAAIAWACGNLLIAGSRARDMFSLMLWISVVPPVPLLLLSLAVDGPQRIAESLLGLTWAGIGATLYLGLASTVLAYSLWGNLLRRHPASVVAPFSLLVPFFGMGSAAAVLGEPISAATAAAFAIVLTGLAAVVVPLPWLRDRFRFLAGAGRRMPKAARPGCRPAGWEEGR